MTRQALEHLVRERQEHDRLPSVSTAILRDGDVVWTCAAGVADAEAGDAATAAHRYRIGSITKTFTAAAVMRLVDAGTVELDTPLRAVLPEWPTDGPTIRRMLAHVSGIQREAPGDVWLTMVLPEMAEILDALPAAEQVLDPGERWHYSNLAYSLLGEVVARRAGCPYEEAVREQLLGPAGLDATGFEPAPPLARGYFVRPYTDQVVAQPDPPLRGFAAAGGLYSTASDLCRWADVFIAETPPAL